MLILFLLLNMYPAKAIEASQNAVTLMEWLIITISTIFAGVVAFLFKSSEKTAKSLTTLTTAHQLSENDLRKTHELLNNLTSHYFEIQNELINITNRIIPYEVASKARELGTITEAEFEESQQWLFWQKWILLKEEEPYNSLLACKRSTIGLFLNIRRVIILELDYLEKKEKINHHLSKEELAIKAKLLVLIDLDRKTLLAKFQKNNL